ncbi:MAG: lactonase family protein [Saprospiraceae bacterium]
MKRLILPLWLVLYSIFFACTYSSSPNSPQQFTLFVGTSTDSPDEGIYAYTLNAKTGHCTFSSKTTEIINPSFLAIHPNNKYLYSLERIKGVEENRVKAYVIHDDYTLQLLNQQSTRGQGACYISVDKMGEQVFIAHYRSGSVVNLPIQSDGTLGEVVGIVQHQGSSIDTTRQKSPHAHYIRQGENNLIYATDLGIDKIQLYQLEEGRLTKNNPAAIATPSGGGPRHLAEHPNKKYLYVMNEMGGSVSVFNLNVATSTFKNLQTISTLPSDFTGFNKSADIHVHPSGKFLYASNRGDYDSIAVFEIDLKTGHLTLVEIEQETIIWPRNFAISPDGKFLLCANLKDDSISVFKIDSATGSLSYTGQQIAVPKPLCVQFLY